MTTLPRINTNLVYFYDLPHGEFTSTHLAKIIKEKTGYDLDRQPQVRRDFNKPFYTAVVQINDNTKFSEVCKVLRYFEINGKNCRALPFQNDLLGTNVKKLAENNFFVRRIPKNLNAENLDQIFSKFGDIISCKISLSSDHESRGYGFVCFSEAQAAQKALESTQNSDSMIGVKFAPRDKKDFRKVYNNIFVKNLPENWTIEEVKKLFSPFGFITSVHQGASQLGHFFFICFGSTDPNDREAGKKSAEKAVTEIHDREVDGHKLYVKPALRKEERKNELMHDTFKFKNSKKRCNLYVKGFPSSTTEEDLRELFTKYGEIESLKLFPAKDQHSPFAFVCYKTPDQASTAKNQLTQQQLDNHPLYVNHYEIKQYRDM